MTERIKGRGVCRMCQRERERTHSYKYKMKVGAYVVLQYPYRSHMKHVSEDSHEQIIYLIGAEHFPPPCK